METKKTTWELMILGGITGIWVGVLVLTFAAIKVIAELALLLGNGLWSCNHLISF